MPGLHLENLPHIGRHLGTFDFFSSMENSTATIPAPFITTTLSPSRHERFYGQCLPCDLHRTNTTTKDTSDQGTSQASLKKAQAAERRREKNKKKEQKECDRQDKKVKKEFDLRNKKERDAKEREEKKEQWADIHKS
eukprot:scaffold170411_cov66-Attheya_sp.AAC.2